MRTDTPTPAAPTVDRMRAEPASAPAAEHT